MKNPVVLVTGSGRGIGKRLALGFAADRARLALVARSKSEIELTHLEIQHAGGESIRVRADVRDYGQVQSAVDIVNAHFGGVDVLVCAAGVQGPIGLSWELDPEAWGSTIHTNLIGVFHCCRAVLPQMIERRSGKIIVLSGGGAVKARPHFSGYAAAKAGAVRLVETIAEEVRDYNIQVNCLGPGATYTHMTDEVLSAGERAGWKDSEEAMKVRATGGVPPDQQIQLALFLASERSNHISGKLIHVSDDWKNLEHAEVNPETFTLRRVKRI